MRFSIYIVLHAYTIHLCVRRLSYSHSIMNDVSYNILTASDKAIVNLAHPDTR